MCKPKDGEGLGVRDIDLFNISLLGKWRWRLLDGGHSLWKEVLTAKYGGEIINEPLLSSLRDSYLASS